MWGQGAYEQSLYLLNFAVNSILLLNFGIGCPIPYIPP